jgi:hypothetical protein
MPSPFPGMDPYLEDRHDWPDFHHRLIYNIAEALQPQLSPRYFARIEKRVYLAEEEDLIVPDVLVAWKPRAAVRAMQPAAAVAVLEPDEPLRAPRAVEHRESYIEIRAPRSDEVVTVIEVLSPSNKRGQGREFYRARQNEVLEAGQNLVEIDLLRAGGHTIAGPRAEQTRAGRWDYVVSVVRYLKPTIADLYPFTLRDRLPRVAIPLRAQDGDVTLDLPGVFTRSFDVACYLDYLDYSQPPPVPLASEDAAWADALLREAGLREEENPRG